MQVQLGRPHRHAAIHGQLRRGQIASLATLGVVLWLLFALLIRYSIPTGLFGNAAASALLFAAAFPLAWLMIRLCRRVAALSPGQVVPGVVVASAAALSCDGLALTWAPNLYGPDAASILPAAAWLFWGVGVSLALALAVAEPKMA